MVIAQWLETLQAQIAVLDREIASRAKADPMAKRLLTIPGVSPVIAAALVALAPAASTFRRGRDFAADSASFPGSTPAVARRGSDEPRRWANAA